MIESNSPLVIFGYILAAFSIPLTSYALFNILLYLPTKTTIARQVLLYLHLSLLIQQLVSFPFAYTTSVSLCRAAGFIHAYSGMSNIIAMWIITVYSVNYVHCMFEWVDKALYIFKDFLCILIPLITLFPLIKNQYGQENNAWCEMTTNLTSENESQIALAVIFYYFWIWFYLIFSIGLLIYAGTDAILTTGWASAKTLISNTGAYGLVSLITWIPHTLRRLLEPHLSPQQDLGLLLPLYITGISYGLLYIWKPSLIHLPDKPHVRNSTVEFNMSDLESIASSPLGTASFSERGSVTSSHATNSNIF
jgi:hypothetical protein